MSAEPEDRAPHRQAILGTRFALTFDDGPGWATAPLLDCLADAGVPAAFFILGSNVEQALWCDGDTAYAESLVCRMLREGHSVGNHTWSHMNTADAMLDLDAFSEDVLRGERVVRRLMGQAGTDRTDQIPFRMPFGPQPYRNAAGKPEPDPRFDVVRKLSRNHVHWTGVFYDWEPIPGGGVELARRLLAHMDLQSASGLDAILLLHDGAPPGPSSADRDRRLVVEAVRTFLLAARQRGWSPFRI